MDRENRDSLGIAFVGAGKMASAMVDGLLKQSGEDPSSLACTCGNDPSGPGLAKRTGIHYIAEAGELASRAEVVVLACKPQQLPSLPELSRQTEGKLILSILAGTGLDTLKQRFPKARACVRAMPNTPGQIGAGITAFAHDGSLGDADRSQVDTILASLGIVIEVEEEALDAITALSGSGPAYLFAFTEALIEAGVGLGLPKDTASLLARETVIGAAKLLESANRPPEALRQAVTSPGGTTEAALNVFQREGLNRIVEHALRAAHHRSIELSQLKGQP